MRHTQIVFTVAVAILASACESGRHSATGFRLPANGDPGRGKAVFLEFGCTGCHKVSGAADLPEASQRAQPVVLGGERTFEMPDGYLVTSIINPTYKRAPHAVMPSHTDRMTVQQLTDLVAFLQTHYKTRDPMSRYDYY